MSTQPFQPVTREDLIQEIAQGLRFDTRKRLHNSEDIMARIAAEKLADHFQRSNLVVVHGPGQSGTNHGRA